jgi:rhomboid family GlyGly-CTERM serine protease
MNAPTTDSRIRSWFRSANCDARYGAALLSLVGLIVALNATGEWGRHSLAYERSGLLRLQWWRLLSAHLVHLSWRHALLNCLGMAILWALFAREFSPARWLWIALLAALCLDAGLWFLQPQIDWYLGASGVLHGAWAAGACAAYRRGEAIGAVLLLLLVIKLIYEQQSGVSIFEGDLSLAPAAHLFGALGGLIGAVVPLHHAHNAKPL